MTLHVRFPDTQRRNKRVLLAEPLDDIAYIMEIVLAKKLGYQVVSFDTTEELLAAFEPGRDKWIFCEATTPTLRTGLLAGVRKIDPTIPFFFHSAYGAEQLVLDAKSAGANGWIEKPWTAQQLTGALCRFEHSVASGEIPEFLWLPFLGHGGRKWVCENPEMN